MVAVKIARMHCKYYSCFCYVEKFSSEVKQLNRHRLKFYESTIYAQANYWFCIIIKIFACFGGEVKIEVGNTFVVVKQINLNFSQSGFVRITLQFGTQRHQAF